MKLLEKGERYILNSSKAADVTFLGNLNFGMPKVVIFIVKIKIPNNTESACNHAKFIGIAKVTIDIYLLGRG